MKTWSIVAALIAITIGGCIYLLSEDESPPPGAAGGLVLSDFGVSTPAAPPPNFSLDMRAYREGGALHIEKLEFFYGQGTVPAPTLTKGGDGSASVHFWVSSARIQLFGTKCEFVRTVRFSIPEAELVGIKKLVIVNHDTGATQVLADSKSLDRLLSEPAVVQGKSHIEIGLPDEGSGCGV